MTELPLLLIMRHAKSSWTYADLSDHDRPLNERGMQAATGMAAYLKRQSIHPERIVSSSALRAVLTARAVAAEFGRTEILVRPGLFEASPATWEEILSELAADQTTLIIGHNPTLAELVSGIAGEAMEFPTAAIAVCTAPSGAATFALDDLKLRDLWQPRHVLSS